MAKQETKLDLIIGAVDRFTAPFQRLNERVATATQGFRRLGASVDRLSQETGLSILSTRSLSLGRSLLGVGNGVASLAQRFARLGSVASLALGAAGGGLGALVSQSAKAGQEVERLAGRAGVSAESFQRLAYAAKLGGADADGFASVLQDLGEKAFDAATGSEDLQETFRALRINIRTSNGDIKKSDQLFAELADAFARMENGPTKTAIALQLFSEEGARLIPLLNQGSAGLSQLGIEAEKLGLVLDKTALANSNSFAKGLDRLQATLSGLGTTVGQSLIPVLTPLIERIQTWAAANREVIAAKVREWVEAFAGRLPELMRGLESVLSSFGKFFSWLGRISDALGGADKLLGIVAVALSGPLLSALGSAGAAFLSFGATLMATPVGWFMAAVAAIVGLATLIYKNWSGISDYFSNLWADFTAPFRASWAATKDFFSNLWEDITGIFESAWNSISGLIRNAWGGISSFFSRIWNGITKSFSDGWKAVVGLIPDFGSIFKGIEKTFAKAWEAIIGLVPDFTNIWERISGTFSRGVAKITEKLPDWLKDWLGIGDSNPVITVPDVHIPGDIQSRAGAPSALPPGSTVGVPGEAAGAFTSHTEISRRETTVRLIPPPGYQLQDQGDAAGVVYADNAGLGYMEDY